MVCSDSRWPQRGQTGSRSTSGDGTPRPSWGGPKKKNIRLLNFRSTTVTTVNATGGFHPYGACEGGHMTYFSDAATSGAGLIVDLMR